MDEATEVASLGTQTPQGVSVFLRAVHPEDFDGLRQVLDEPGIGRWWRLYDGERVRAEFLGNEVGVYAVEADGKAVGAIEYVESADPDYRHADVDLFVTERMRETGTGTTALRLLTRHLLEDLGQHRVVGAPGSQNAEAIAMFEEVGFHHVGRLRQYERQSDGTWQDCELLELLRADFEA